MTGDARQTPSSSNRSKRRWTDVGDDSGQNVEEHHSAQKRQRVSQACDICRSRKDRCDGAKPICSTCASLNRPCTYKPNPKKRGLPTGYLRTLELLWGAVFCKVRGSEQTVRKLLKMTNLPGSAEDTSKEGELSETFLSTWKNSTTLKEIEKLLSGSELSDEGVERTNQDNLSPRGTFQETIFSPVSLEWHDPEEAGQPQGVTIADGTQPQQVRSAQSNLPSARQTRDTGTQCDLEPKTGGWQSCNTFPARAQSTADHGMPRNSEMVELVLPENTRHLLDIYFSYTHCWFPILEKHDILRTAFSYNESPTQVSCSSPGSGDHAAMWAILALASIQHSARGLGSGSSGSQRPKLNPDSLYATARRLIPSENGFYEAGHVQSLLILAMVRIGHQEWSSSWILIGLAIRIAVSLGLDGSSITRNSTTTLNRQPHGRSKHIFLGCFILDTLVAAEMGCAPLLMKEDVSRTGVLDEDGLEEWHPWEDPACFLQGSTSRDFFLRGPLHAMSTFNRLVSVMSILNDFRRWMRGDSFALSEVEEFERRLQHWTSSLPGNCLLEPQGNNSAAAAPHLLVLHIIHQSLVAAVLLRSQVLLNDNNPAHRDLNHRVNTTLKELVRLVQTYIDNYSISATPPTFSLLLRLATCGLYEGNGASLTLVLDSELRLKLQTLLSQLSLTWASRSTTSHENMSTGQLPISPNAAPSGLSEYSGHLVVNNSALGEQSSLATGNPRYGTFAYSPNEGRREIDITGGNSARPATAPDSTPSVPWMRAMPDLDASMQLPLQSPAASLPPGPTSAHTPAHLSGGIGHSVSSTNDLSAPSNPLSQQYSHVHNGSNIDTGNLVNVDSYGLSGWSRIPPDLDSLFAEMASLEGTDKTENHPAFMRNLGFTPNSGISELYNPNSHIDPFLLPQTQQVAQASHRSVEDNRRITHAR